MEWAFEPGRAKPGRPAVEKASASGAVIKVPAIPPLPPRDLYRATIDARDWPGTQAGLVEFWTKLCEVWPEYHSMEETTSTWDRIMCTADVMGGYVRAQARLDRGAPAHPRLVTVFASIPFVAELNRGLPEMDPDNDDDEWGKAYEALNRQLVKALAAAAGTEPAKSKLTALRQRHAFDLMVTAPEAEDAARKLRIPK